MTSEQPESAVEVIQADRDIREHPCHGLFATAGDKLSHRHWFQDDQLMPTCERCGTPIDRNHKEVGPICWEPEKRREVITVDHRYAISNAAMKALGEWLAWPDAARDGPREVTVEQTLSFLRGLPNRLGYGATQPAEAQGAGEDFDARLSTLCDEGWKFGDGPPPDYDSPLSQVYDAGIGYAWDRLAEVLGVTNYEGGDGSEDYATDVARTGQNILVAAGYANEDGDLLTAAELRAAAPKRETGKVERIAAYIDQIGDSLETTLAKISEGQPQYAFDKEALTAIRTYREVATKIRTLAAAPQAPADASGEVAPDVRHRLLEVAKTLDTAKGNAFALNFHQLAHDIRAALSTTGAK
jgi:hypothetical protein